ncbi:hypothetical protein ACFFRR_000746 [Megaselia abdita]
MENNNQQEKSKNDVSVEARKYVDNLVRNGELEQDNDSEMMLPPWYNAELCKIGQEQYFNYRFVITGGMLAGLIAVFAIPSILKVLISTKQSGTPITAYKRYVRTILHTICWHSHPFVPGSKSWQSLEMVRKAHLRSSKQSTRKNTGIISQKDLALTQFGFIGFLSLDAANVGITDPKYFEGTVHLWRTIGYMLGMSDEFNLCTESWETTKPRLLLIREEFYKPALENTTPEFLEMTKALINGLWAHLPTLTVGSFLFFTKRMAKCEGYEFFDSDFPNGKRIEGKKQHYDSLSMMDKFTVSYGLFLSDRLHKYTIVRKYINFRTWLNFKISEYLPLLAIIMFGVKAAYVKIFFGSKPNELHID